MISKIANIFENEWNYNRGKYSKQARLNHFSLASFGYNFYTFAVIRFSNPINHIRSHLASGLFYNILCCISNCLDGPACKNKDSHPTDKSAYKYLGNCDIDVLQLNRRDEIDLINKGREK